MPKYLIGKHAILNEQNNDDKCFVWAVLSTLHPQANHAERMTKYIQFESELNLTGIEFPLKINNVEKFENFYSSISVNVFACDDKAGVFPVFLTNYIDKKHVNQFLLIQVQKSHYSWIKDMSRLLSKPGYDRVNISAIIIVYTCFSSNQHLTACGRLQLTGITESRTAWKIKKRVYFKSI